MRSVILSVGGGIVSNVALKLLKPSTLERSWKDWRFLLCISCWALDSSEYTLDS